MNIGTHGFLPIVGILFTLALNSYAASSSSTGSLTQDWELVRTVTSPYGNPDNLVLIPEAKKHDRDYYKGIGLKLCGVHGPCSVYFWTDKEQIPFSSQMPVKNLWELTATYEAHPNYTEPHTRLACWLYKDRESGEAAKCFYMPGKKYWQQSQQ